MHKKSSSQNMTAATKKRGNRTKQTIAFLIVLRVFIITSNNNPICLALCHDLVSWSWVTCNFPSFYSTGRFEWITPRLQTGVEASHGGDYLLSIPQLVVTAKSQRCWIGCTKALRYGQSLIYNLFLFLIIRISKEMLKASLRYNCGRNIRICKIINVTWGGGAVTFEEIFIIKNLSLKGWLWKTKKTIFKKQNKQTLFLKRKKKLLFLIILNLNSEEKQSQTSNTFLLWIVRSYISNHSQPKLFFMRPKSFSFVLHHNTSGHICLLSKRVPVLLASLRRLQKCGTPLVCFDFFLLVFVLIFFFPGVRTEVSTVFVPVVWYKKQKYLPHVKRLCGIVGRTVPQNKIRQAMCTLLNADSQ